MAIGLRRLGFEPVMTRSQQRISAAPAVLFGTTFWQDIERSPGEWLLVDRACWGDPDYVRLGWNGRGTQADYRIPADPATRWVPEVKRHEPGEKVILCGDYGCVPTHPDATHFKPHPASPDQGHGLPLVDSFEDCKYAICGASTVAVDLILRGIPVVLTDPRNMAHMPLDQIAWTQWSWDEIAAGQPIGHLFEWLRSKEQRNSRANSQHLGARLVAGR